MKLPSERKIKLLQERAAIRNEQRVDFQIVQKDLKTNRLFYINVVMDQDHADNELHCFMILFVKAWKNIQNLQRMGHTMRTIAIAKKNRDNKIERNIRFPWRRLLVENTQVIEQMFTELEVADMPRALDTWPQQD